MGKATPEKRTVQQEQNPWQPAQGNLKDILTKSSALAGNVDLFKPQFGQTTQDGVQQLIQSARDPSQAVAGNQQLAGGSSQSYLDGLRYLNENASGANLSGNPYFNSVLDDATQRNADQVNSQFSGAGRFGSGAHAGVLTRELGNLRNSAMMGNYNNERGIQVDAQNQLFGHGTQAGQFGQAADASRTGAAQNLLAAGGIQDTINEATQRAPLSALEWQQGMTVPIAGLGSQGSTTQTQTPARQSGLQTALGGALSLGGLFMGMPGLAGAGNTGTAGGLLAGFNRI